jgi:hypothetical protein
MFKFLFKNENCFKLIIIFVNFFVINMSGCVDCFYDLKKHLASTSSCNQNDDRQQTMRVMSMVRPYFLSAYTNGTARDKKTRIINGTVYSVERANHGLAHGLRQGALAKDIFKLLISYPIEDTSGIVEWGIHKQKEDPQWIQKIEMAACFQRSGRQSECSSANNPELYKQYEIDDTINFRNHARHDPMFTNELERSIFEEAILWSNPGSLDENKNNDLKYLRRILHAAHTLDLRRILSFDGEKIQQEAMTQLFGTLPSNHTIFQRILWDRSGEYLRATGDRDLVNKRYFQNRFFIQTSHPPEMVDAIHRISQTIPVSLLSF